MALLFLYLCLFVAIAIAVIYIFTMIFSHTPRKHDDSELHYVTNIKGEMSDLLPLPPKNSPASDEIILSVVVPCYNETERLKLMLDEAISFLQKEYGSKYEILIVDDGSKDGTAEYALSIAIDYNLKPGVMRVIKLVKNRGKGGAVTHGLQYIRGNYGLFADADGASKFSDVTKLIEAISGCKAKSLPGMAIGSRAHMVDTDAVVRRSCVRNFLMYSLHTLVFIFGIRSINDTQCGFKLFNKASIPLIFPFMHTERWIFDVEILILAIRKNIQIKEVPISWHEVDGSKVDLARDSIGMAVDLVVTRLAYIFAIYKDAKEKTE